MAINNELISYMEATMANMLEIARAKNRDYAGANATDPFRNFNIVAELGIGTPEQGLLTRMSDKFMRIINLTKQQASVADETIQDTLIDLANYALILAALIDHKKARARGLLPHSPADQAPKSLSKAKRA